MIISILHPILHTASPIAGTLCASIGSVVNGSGIFVEPFNTLTSESVAVVKVYSSLKL